MLANTLALDSLWLYRVGGISSFVLVAGYFLTFPVYAWVGDPPPSGIEAQFADFAEHATGWWTILGLMVFMDILYIPAFLSLYQALKEINRNAMLLVAVFKGFIVSLVLPITWTSCSALIISGVNYAAAKRDAQKAALIATAGYPSVMHDSPLLGTYAILIPSLVFLLAGRCCHAKGNLQQDHGLFSLGCGNHQECFHGFIFCGLFRNSSNRQCPSRDNLGLVCRPPTLQARSAGELRINESHCVHKIRLT